MKPNNNKTVLFIFSLSASIEAERKPIFGSHKKNISKDFFRTLNKKTLSIAKESNVDVVLLDETRQKGKTFSERYINAYKSLFNQGYDKVVSIGNDTPNLTADHIKSAIRSLSNKEVVFGPSKDGGIYLLGLTKNAFDEQAFKKLSWLTSTLSKEIENFSKKNKYSFSVLEALVDIDFKNDALEFAYSNTNLSISTYILFHFEIHNINYKRALLTTSSQASLNNFLLRGPPLSL
jgi:glycosyltransferase A (GT-A) superfamily protein (DUF2064 family)